jgi:hypothetical protein
LLKMPALRAFFMAADDGARRTNAAKEKQPWWRCCQAPSSVPQSQSRQLVSRQRALLDATAFERRQRERIERVPPRAAFLIALIALALLSK